MLIHPPSRIWCKDQPPTPETSVAGCASRNNPWQLLLGDAGCITQRGPRATGNSLPRSGRKLIAIFKVNLLQGRVPQDFQQVCGPIGAFGVQVKAPGMLKRGLRGSTDGNLLPLLMQMTFASPTICNCLFHIFGLSMLPNVIKETAVTMALTFEKKTRRLTNWPNIATKFAKRGTLWSLLLSNSSSWYPAASATQRTESSRTLGDSGTPSCSASDVAGLRHMRRPGSGLHRLFWTGRPTGGRPPPLKTAPDQWKGRWTLRWFFCRWCQCRSRHRQEQQQQPWAPGTHDPDPAVESWAIWNWTSHDCSVACLGVFWVESSH